ncbi:hypothetical protein J1N35_006820 [Gossypium stocksii]|uniref:Reverse transcriptase zinc-binding domain-containing protein n=1 Tax=Gossypium stocksii TaxID=47602 RepID=A0A9D4ACW0_9ROSI|nr:hypothetical protein J1N35_006820 [Gossypium stocksii]
MVRRGFVQESTCGVCGHVSEDILHVLRNCTTAKSIWDRLILAKWHTRMLLGRQMTSLRSRSEKVLILHWSKEFITCWSALVTGIFVAFLKRKIRMRID